MSVPSWFCFKYLCVESSGETPATHILIRFRFTFGNETPTAFFLTASGVEEHDEDF